MIEAQTESRAHLISSVLAGSWRRQLEPLEITGANLSLISEQLINSGAGALVWRRLRDTPLSASQTAFKFRQAYRMLSLQSALDRRKIKEAFTFLRDASIEPVLVKGWSIARLYPEPGLRPHGDIDLCVRREQYEFAKSLLDTPEGRRHGVDLHCEFRKLDSNSFDALFARTRLAELEGEEIRILCPEDQLRVLCFHFLREGGWRPLWLCDIALAFESRPADFDWEKCLGKNRRRARWIASAIALAGQILNANISDSPLSVAHSRLPKWLVPTILKEWVSAHPSLSQRHRAPMNSYLRSPAGLLSGLRHRWPNPIEATISLGGSFNEFPRLPFQIGNCFLRAAGFLAQLPKAVTRT